jgi:hypothetical protein
MNIEYTSDLTVGKCQSYPEYIFVFGDNLAGIGTAGQAIIRHERNAFGIPTKRYPSMHIGAFFKDNECEREHVLKSLRELYTLARKHTIVFPTDGVGTGMAKMQQYSPDIFKEMNDILLKHFNIRNGNEPNTVRR